MDSGLTDEPDGDSRHWTRVVLSDLGAGGLGTLLAILFLWYLHGRWMPGWSLICGGVGGVATRRFARPGYASFPAYLRVPLSAGLVALGTLTASWATLVREPSSYWLLRWREATTMPVLAAVLGLGLTSLIYTYRRLESEIAAKQRLEDDLEVASRIQKSLLRSRPPARHWVEMHAVNIASRQVGGDYYEILDGDDGVCIAVGDVSGKGVPAALLMSSLQSAFLAAHSVQPELDEICGLVNRFLFERTTPERYATFFVARMTPDGHLVYVNAGHNPPLLIGGGCEQRLFGGGMPLGLFPDATYECRELHVSPQDVLVVYTDGVTEPTNTAGEEFGEGRLARVVSSHRGGSTADIAAAILDAIASHTGGQTASEDDVTLLVMRAREQQSVAL